MRLFIRVSITKMGMKSFGVINVDHITSLANATDSDETLITVQGARDIPVKETIQEIMFAIGRANQEMMQMKTNERKGK